MRSRTPCLRQRGPFLTPVAATPPSSWDEDEADDWPDELDEDEDGDSSYGPGPDDPWSDPDLLDDDEPEPDDNDFWLEPEEDI